MALTDYERKVCKFLDEMAPGTRYHIKEIATAKTREIFIAATKRFMDSFPFQGYVTFNHDYTEIYKTSSIKFEE